MRFRTDTAFYSLIEAALQRMSPTGVGQTKDPSAKRALRDEAGSSTDRPPKKAARHVAMVINGGVTGVIWNQELDQWEVVWWVGAWRRMTGFNVCHYWPEGKRTSYKDDHDTTHENGPQTQENLSNTNNSCIISRFFV